MIIQFVIDDVTDKTYYLIVKCKPALHLTIYLNDFYEIRTTNVQFKACDLKMTVCRRDLMEIVQINREV